MASAAFTIEGLSLGASVIVVAGTTIDLALTSVTGVRLIEWSIVGGSDSLVAVPTITPAGPTGATATFSVAAESAQGIGLAWVVQCRINGGVDDAGQVVSSYTRTGIVGIANRLGYLPFAVGERLERNATHGIADDMNAQLAGAGTSIGLIIAISRGDILP